MSDIEYLTDDNISFSCDIYNGYSFRGFIEQVSTLNLNEIIFIFHILGVKLISYNADKTLIVSCDIERQYLTKYVISTDEKTILIKKVKTEKLLNILNVISMKTSFSLYKHANETNLYYRYLKDLSCNSMEGGVIESEILTIVPNFDECNIDKYNDYKPNCVIPVAELESSNKNYKGKQKNVNISFIFYDSWMRIKSTDNNNVLMYDKPFGNNPNANSMYSITSSKQNDGEIVDTYKFNSKTILKALSLFSKMNKGVVLFYCEKDKPLKIHSKIVDYGQVSIYIVKKKEKL